MSQGEQFNPISLDSLLFPEASGNFSRVLSSLKQSKHSIRNRLASIYKDSLFVKSIAEHYGLPLVANERCGSWYIHPEDKIGSVYFKSTDGHYGQWRFNTRRLNLQLLEIVEANCGCIVVDSTRRGKILPDALAKTFPIWCAVMNRYLFPERPDWHVLRTPPEAVGLSEHAQMEARFPTFVEDLNALALDVEALRRTISRPIMPVFLFQGSQWPVVPETDDFYIVVCCSASSVEATDGDDGYIQGGGDDTEHWACGLTADAFWRNRRFLASDCTDTELQERIKGVMATDTLASRGSFEPVYVAASTPLFYVGDILTYRSSSTLDFDGIVLCRDTKHDVEVDPDNPKKQQVLFLDCSTGKNGSRALRGQLSRLPAFMDQIFERNPQPKLLFVCSTGKDLSIGVALVVLCLYYDDGMVIEGGQREASIDKTYIRQRLVRIQTSLPNVNPSRATLQAVNSFLMERQN